MVKGWLVFLILIVGLFLIGNIAADSVDSEIKKITYYAQEYETGNINYVKLLVYISESRQNLNEFLGAAEKDMGGVLKQDKIREVLGEPIEETKWVWVEGEEHDKKLDIAVPVWKKIIFDGKKIRITLDAWPSIFTKRNFNEEENPLSEIKEGDLIYRLNFWIEFKKSEEQPDIGGKIDEIKNLAEVFSSDSSQENAEILAKETVNAEKTFESYFRQNPGKCEDLMTGVFGSENQMPVQNLIVQEISFYSGEDFEIIARLEMCDECEWNWINLDLWAETRGAMGKMDESSYIISPEQFRDKDSDYFKSEITSLLDSYKRVAEEKNWGEANRIKQKIWAVNDAWNQKANNVWEEVNKMFESQIEGMTEQERIEFNQDYGWIKQEQERRKKAKELMKINYEERKQFYQGLFSGYEKKEYSFIQTEFKKRLIELFRERGEEICNNNIDDNQNEEIDCGDNQCGGKICGRGLTIVTEGNETREVEVDFYCIAGECKAKEEIIITKNAVCGNHLCEEGETSESCSEDCSLCPVHPPLSCQGKVIFSGKDENGCPLAPTCVEEQVCNLDEDCKFLCGNGECVEGKCRVKELVECKEAECADGEQKTLSCESEESIISEICSNKLWTSTGLMCSGASTGTEEVAEESIVGDQCTTASDCGGVNDVCSNGQCVTIPEKIEAIEETTNAEEVTGESDQENQEETGEVGESGETETGAGEVTGEPGQENQEEPEESITGETIFAFFRALFLGNKITGKAITGFEGEEGNTGSVEESAGDIGATETGGVGEGAGAETREIGERIEEPNNFYEEQREGEDEERRETENRERCENDCARPCVEKCIRESCGEELQCDLNEEQRKCESSCVAEDVCIDKCMLGGDWWKEFENQENKEEKGGFEAGGSCRTVKGRTEGFIWFGGWGDPFEKIQPIKQKYYSGGSAEWCKSELENLIKQREEFEKGFNQEFAKWFFEDYLANSAENWEQAISGIFELYWKNVDNQREIAFRMKCLDKNDIKDVMDYNLIEIDYKTDYGSLEYWEEAKEVNIQGLDEPVIIISPYMKLWVFPPKEFIKYEMKKAMKNHEFPGPPEEKVKMKNEGGLTDEERGLLKQDEKFMEKIRDVANKYDGNADVVVQFKEGEDIVFNLYAQVNEEEILKLEPMLPEEVVSQDVLVEIDFQQIYELIYEQEKEMRGQMTERPPWDRKIQPLQKMKDAVNGIKMYFKMRSIMNSARFTPEEAGGDVKDLFKKFFSMMREGEEQEEGEEKTDEGGLDEEEIWESKEAITGQIIFS